jgi:hypothetical protein
MRGGPQQRAIAQARSLVPRHYPPFEQIVIGTDQSTWVRVRAAQPNAWQVLDERGAEIGRVSLPGDVTLHIVDRNRLHVVRSDSLGVASLAILGVVRER